MAVAVSGTMTNRTLLKAFLVAGLGTFVSCSGSPAKNPVDLSYEVSDPQAFTLSYRSRIRVPDGGVRLRHAAFVEQINQYDPIAAIRCAVSGDQDFAKAVDDLGGFPWEHPIAVLKDQSEPPLYKGRLPPPRPTPDYANAGAVDDRSPTIERPDLVGYQGNLAIFLSKRHGLMAVKTDGPSPEVSCALKLPGQPKSFFYKGNELVLLVNGTEVTNNNMLQANAALLRFRVIATGFDFLGQIALPEQNIADARLFDQTLVVYTTMQDARPEAPVVAPNSGAGTGGAGTGNAGAPASDFFAGPTRTSRGMKLLAVKWNDAFKIDWQEDLINDPAPRDDLYGRPAEEVLAQKVGDVVGTTRSFRSFISASDRYVVVSRDVNRTIFDGIRQSSWSHCVASHESPPRVQRDCNPKYEQRKNPDYREPKSSAGDYACNGKKLEDCIQEAAPQISRYIYVRTGETCQNVTYRDWICDRQETLTNSYPEYHNAPATQFLVFRYVDGDFVKLDEKLFRMGDPQSASDESLTFAESPLEVAGRIEGQGDLQFQNGHFYALTDVGRTLNTLLIAGNSVAHLGKLALPSRQYAGAHSVLFSGNRLMVSGSFWEQGASMERSDIAMVDLTAASFPRLINQFAMPGSSKQLLLANGGIMGPGTVSLTSSNVQRNLQKITLFDRNTAEERDNVLLGTEFNANLDSSSWGFYGGEPDDQRIRLDVPSQRLFLPYSGTHHAPSDRGNWSQFAYRLNITRVDEGRLAPEITFDMVEPIIRTVSLIVEPSAQVALAFGDSSVYAVARNADVWSMATINEFATPEAVYRLTDERDVHVRFDRIGKRCKVSTFEGSIHAFAGPRLATGPDIECWSYPVAIGSAVVFPDSANGWRVSGDGKTFTVLNDTEVKALMAKTVHHHYCTMDPSREDGTPVASLDVAPASIRCLPLPGAMTPGPASDDGAVAP